MRGDAGALPFPAGTFDAVCCFAALYFIDAPMRAIDEIVRVLAPGGRVALLASVARGPVPAGAVDAIVRRLSGTRVFGSAELTGALQERGLTAIDRGWPDWRSSCRLEPADERVVGDGLEPAAGFR